MAKVISDYLDEAYRFCPDKTAFEDKNRSITYKELYYDAQQIAKLFLSIGICHKPIIVFLPNCVECAILAYAIAYSANFFTNADLSLGAEGISELVLEFQPELIVTDSIGMDILSQVSTQSKVMTYEECLSNQSECNTEHISIAISTDPYPVPYTSGSTGKPKGAIHTHRSLLEGVSRYCEVLELDEKSRIAEFSANMFGIFYMNICNTVRSRCYEYIFSQEEKVILTNAFETIHRLQLNKVSCISVLLEIVKRQGCLEEITPNCIDMIAFVGAVVSAETINYWRSALSGIRLRQYYGASEAIMESYFEIEKEYNDGSVLPIGKGFRDNELIVLEEKNGKLLKAQEGELYIRSGDIAVGYYKNPGLTSEAFVQNPCHNDYPDIVYKTGDFVRRDIDGNLVFIGRKDSMVKRRGYRIELGEIDAKFSTIKGIRECVTIFDKNTEKITTFYVGEIAESKAYVELKKLLRIYAVPDHFIKLEVIPRGKNYKTDRNALLKMVKN